MPASVLRRAAKRLGVRRHHVASVRTGAERQLFSALRRRHDSPHGRVLCYHSVGTPSWGVNDVAPRRFRRHVELAVRAGYRFVPASDVACGEAGPCDLALTFDDGLVSTATHAIPVLREMAIPWTLFVVTNWADGQHDLPDGILLDWRKIELLAAGGGIIGSHSVTHSDFGRLEPGRAAWELAESKRIVDERLGVDCVDFAIPFGQSRNWSPAAQEAAVAAGYEHVFAQAGQTRPAGTVPRTFISRHDTDRVFVAALNGRFDTWEEWY